MEVAARSKLEPPPPDHVAIIMDGNGRWARARGLPRTAGHKRGARAVKTAMESAISLGVRYLTLFGFSSENWKRPADEVQDLKGLLKYYLRNEVDFLNKNGVQLRVIGERQRFGDDIVRLIEQVENVTAPNRRLTVTIALSYGGRAEIVAVARRLAAEAEAGRLDPTEIDEQLFSQRLYTAGMPDPDLLIRTSGEQRISNFLLWQLAYGEFVFIDTLWPDFSHDHFADALREFHRRERRYGAATA
ncbi:MAG: di-trans,poly-cis-decaprenylcistransferase [Rhodospirillales bacterium]|nr:di-trans,poly-cis-decaprenylcistransferase [Rhodospirillales bacterium]